MNIKEGTLLFLNGIKLSWQMMRGASTVNRLNMPIVTVFGGCEALAESPYYQQAYALAKRCAQHKISTITGGGPGIMYAANCGAKDGKPKEQKEQNTLGIAVYGVDEQFENNCSPLFWVNTFFVRQWLMVRYALVIVVFPGGLGTMDELFEVLNLMKHGRVPAIPVILIGVDYWQPIVLWMKEQAEAQGYMPAAYRSFFIVTDSVDEAFSLINRVCEQYKKTAI